MLRRAFDVGIFHFDLANNYGPPPGSAEETFGKVLAQDLRPYRDELVISTKAGYRMWPGPFGEWGSRKYLLAGLDQSLQRMGLDYIPIFYSHRFDPDTPLEETMGALDTALDSGMIPADRIERIRGLNGIAGERGQTLAQMALSWVLRRPEVTSALIGASSVGQIEENVAAAAKVEFSDDELAAIDRFAVDSAINLWG